MLHCIFSNRVVIVNVHNWNEDIRDETEEALASNPVMFASMLLLGVSFPMASSKGMGGLPFSGAYFLSKATTHVCTSLPLPRARQPQVTAPEAAHTLSRRLSALTAPLMWPSRSSEVDSPPFFATGCPGSVRASAAGPGMASLCISYIHSFCEADGILDRSLPSRMPAASSNQVHACDLAQACSQSASACHALVPAHLKVGWGARPTE